MTYRFIILTCATFIPTIALGATVTPPHDLKSLTQFVLDIIGLLTQAVFVLTLFVFFWGTLKGFVIQGGSEEGVADGKSYATMGIVAFVVMASFWGILYLLQNTFIGN